MITGQIEDRIDPIRDAFRSGGITKLVDVIEQITHLLFLRHLDDPHTLEENESTRLKKPTERRIFPEANDGIGQDGGRPSACKTTETGVFRGMRNLTVSCSIGGIRTVNRGVMVALKPVPGALFLMAMLVVGAIFPSYAAELQKFTDARLIDNPANDGDSSLVEANGKRLHVRLYFVDCPETSVSAKSDARRVREQTRYFGLPEAARTIHFGEQAKIFVRRALAMPFTLDTAFASALGRSSEGRVYGFITTADGHDLASLLVENGFARTRGAGRRTPNGMSRTDMVATLRDLETSAMLKRVGVWSESNPDLIVKSRTKQRGEDRELKNLQARVKKAQSPHGSIDLNTASEKELQTIKGIGPVLAARIIAGRPYETIADLLKVKGIGRKTLANIRPHVVVE